MRFSSIRVCGALCVVLVLSASALFGSGAKEETSAKLEGKKGGTLVIARVGTSRHFNGAVMSGNNTLMVSAQIYASLLRYDKDWNLKPYLAESWEVSEDGLSVTLNLVENAVFHDGEPLTSEDVAFTLPIVRDNHPFGKNMLEPIREIETPDEHTVIIRLSQPHPAVLMALAAPLSPILPKHVYGDGQDIKNHPMNLEPIGAGPFKFVEYKQGEYLILERFDDYFIEDRPYLDKMIIKYIKDANNRVLTMERGEAHMSALENSPESLLRLKKMDDIEITREGWGAAGPIWWIAFNLRKKPLSNVKVRKAIAYAIDRKFIVNELFHGLTEEATGPIHPNSIFYSPAVERYDLDLDRANRLLDEAGYPRDGSGTRFKLSLTWPGGPAGRINCEFVAASLKKVGIEVVMEGQPDHPSWAKRMANWDFELTHDAVYNWGDPVIGVHRTYLCDNIKHQVWTNTQGYCSDEAEDLMARAAIEWDVDERKKLYADLQAVIMDDLPLYPLICGPLHTVYKRNLRNVVDSIWGIMHPRDELYFAAMESE